MSANEWVSKNMNFREIKKFLLQWLEGGEAHPEYPWEDGDEAMGPLAFGPGLLWADGARMTLRMTYVPYEIGTGIADDMNGQPGTFQFARFYRLFIDDVVGAAPFTIAHPMGVFPPQVQMVERIVGFTDTWRVYDIHGAGGTIDYITDNETISIDPGAPWQGYVTVVG